MQGKTRTSRKQRQDGPVLVFAALAMLAAVVLGRPVARALTIALRPALYVILTVVTIWLAIGVARFVMASPAARRNYPLMVLARCRWRWTCRAMALVLVDQHRGRKSGKGSGEGKPRVRHPRARFRADPYGVTAAVKTVPKVGRAEFERAAVHLADEWRCCRVSVSQPGPGRLAVRGLRRDPLALPTSMDDAPPGTYESSNAVRSSDAIGQFRPYLGRDEWAEDRYADLSGLTGITIVGLPGTGKTSLVLSLLWQLAGTGAVQFVFIDGKGGGDYSAWRERAWLSSGDELPDAAAVLEDVHSLMRKRLGAVATGTGPRNAWHLGPAPDNPLIVTVIDEAHTFFDLDSVKGDKDADQQVRACRTLTGQLVRKGRSVLFVTIVITQKGTSDAIPTAIRDNCRLGFSFGVKTRDAAVAGLGESIKEYPSYCPTTLRDPSMVGVCTSSLPTGSDPFVRLRVPEISEAAAAARARETAHLRTDPSNRQHVGDLPALSAVAS
jgi:S-DNA-T family DNA segregation ATPase FtsK/SpoIIIE